jgi:hypothetical protein
MLTRKAGFKAADKSTLAHEAAHIFARNLKMMAERENASDWAKKDWQVLREWAGAAEGEALTRDQHEKIADGFLNYLETGWAPIKALKAIFKRFARWLRDLIRQGKSMKLEISPAVREVYDRMLVPQGNANNGGMRAFGEEGTQTATSAAQVPAPDPAPQTPSRRVAEIIADKLSKGEPIGKNQDLLNIANPVLNAPAPGETALARNADIKDVYDAMELGVNLYLQRKGYDPSKITTPEEAEKVLSELNGLLSMLPTQANRTEEQNEFQQFSTPPHLSWLANWLLEAGKGDIVLEPSAGVGGLAVFAKNSGAKVVVNELSKRRAELLKELSFDAVFTENAEHLDNILPDGVKPTRIVMNPPFSSTAGRIPGQRDTKNATAHIEQALSRLEPGGRLVAILGKGMASDAKRFKGWWNKIGGEYNIRANVEIDGKEYRKYGTSFGNILVVIDKDGPTQAAPITGKYDTVIDAMKALAGVRGENKPAGKADESGTVMEDLLKGLRERRDNLEREQLAQGKVPVADARLEEQIRKVESQIEAEKRQTEEETKKPVVETRTTEKKKRNEYTLDSGESLDYLYDAAPDGFVLKNGSPVWGRVTEELTDGREDVPVGELRVQVGDEFKGLIHAKDHENQIRKMGFKNAEDFIDHVYQKANMISPMEKSKYFMVYRKEGKNLFPSVIVAWKP